MQIEYTFPREVPKMNLDLERETFDAQILIDW